MLYWAEGSKSRNRAVFANSDPEMVRMFVSFLRTYFGLRDENILVACYLYADHAQRKREIEKFWLDVTGLPETSLRRSIVNVIPSTARESAETNFLTGLVVSS
jgi:hypothetical protein